MANTEFETQVLSALATLQSDVSTLKSDVSTLKSDVWSLNNKFDRLSEDLTEFREEQKDFNTAIWSRTNQAFDAINDIRSEVVSPWKIRQSKIV